jgi:hypothetical protein
MTKASTLSALTIAATLTLGSALEAQAWNYPAFQPPTVVSREFNFGIADAGRGGTTLLFQWREGSTPRTQFQLEAGLVSPDARADNFIVLGGGWAYQLHNSNTLLPLDFLLTAGAGLALGDLTALRVPLGVSIGHTFPLEGSASVTPYVHPRISLDFCDDCGDEVSLGVDFDLGVNFDVTQALSLRGSAYFGGGDIFGRNGIGFSLAWKSPALR